MNKNQIVKSCTKSFYVSIFLSINLFLCYSCCSIPLVDCGPKIQRITLQNDSIFFDANKNRCIRFELFEYKHREINTRFYDLNLNAVIDSQDSLDFSTAKFSLIQSKDTISTLKHLVIKDTVIENYRNMMFSIEFDNISKESYDFILIENIKLIEFDTNNRINYNHKVQILNK